MSDVTPPPDMPEGAKGSTANKAKKTMGIDPYERGWMLTAIVLLVAFASMITIAGFSMGFTVPGADKEVDPRTVSKTEPWDKPGLREISPGVFEAYVVAQTWSYSPRELVVPKGAEVTLYVTSADLQHGFKITDTNVNMQIVPGQVSKLSFTFDEIGEFPYICTEYCGKGHAAMFGQVTVVSQKDFDARQEAEAAAASSTTTTPTTTTTSQETPG